MRGMRGMRVAAGILPLAREAGACVDKENASVVARRRYWAFQVPVRPPVPQIRSPWVRNPIDAFILQSLQAKKLTPSKPLDREHLLRRVTYDLTGLPPTPGEIDFFLPDRAATGVRGPEVW